MGAAASAPDGRPDAVPADLDVLQPGRPLHVFLSSAAPAHGTQAGKVPDAGAAIGATESLRSALPQDPDHDFWAALFLDFVVFDLAAQPPHRAALRQLCVGAVRSVRGDRGAAAGAARSARAIALSVRAAIPRLRDYAEESAESSDCPAPAREVLGALLLSARVLPGLAEGSDITTLCLVLGSDGPHDCLSLSDRADVGRSAVWQLLTCALDCIARPHPRDPVAPSIALASISVVLVALSTTYLAPPPPPPPPETGGTAENGEVESQIGGGSTGLIASIVDKYSRPGDVLSSLLELAADGSAYREGSRGSTLATTTAYQPAAQLVSPFDGPSVYQVVTEGETLVASVSRRLSNVMLPRTPLDISAGGSGQQLSPFGLPLASPTSPATILAAFTSRLPTPTRTVSFPSSMSWAQSPLEKEALVSSGDPELPRVPPRTPSASLAGGPPMAMASSAPETAFPGQTSPRTSLSALGEPRSGDSRRSSSTGAPVHRLSPQIIARAPTLLGEQALALVAILCAPREESEGDNTVFAQDALNGDRPSTANDFDHPPGQPLPSPNPYRAALQSLHDLPPQTSGDDFAYSFRRLYETLGAWVEDPRGALVAYHLIVGNKKFRTFVLARTDPDVLLLPLLAALYARASPNVSAAPADSYVPAIIVLILSSDAGFCAAIDEIVVPLSSLLWYEERMRLNTDGLSLSGIALLVCIRCIQQSVLSKRRVIESFLAATCMSILGNMSSSVTGINNLAADRLVALTDFLGKRRRKAALTASHERDMPVSPPPVRTDLASPRLLSVQHTACVFSKDDGSPLKTSPASGSEGGLIQSSDPSVEASTVNSSIPVSQGPGVAAKDVLGSAAASQPEGTGEVHDLAFRRCGVEASESDCEATLTELLDTLLEVVASILRSRSNISVNRHLVYSLLHRESVFSADYVGDVSVRSRVVSGRICRVISFFSKLLDTVGVGAVGSTQGQVNPAGAPTSRNSLSLASAWIDNGTVSGMKVAAGTENTRSGPGISVDLVFDVIDRYARILPRDALFSLPELRFNYCESKVPRDFFLPYAWVLAMRGSPLRWDPAQYPDSRIPLTKSVFNAPRPPHGSGSTRT